MSLSVKAKDEMLGVFVGRSLMLGLFTGSAEIEDPRYQRMPVTFGAPQREKDVSFIENTEEILFSDMVRGHTFDHWGVFDEAGELLSVQPLVKDRDADAEDRAWFKPGSLSIGMP